MKRPIVVKIGGSLLVDADSWRRVLDVYLEEGLLGPLVISACRGVTDILVQAYHHAVQGDIGHSLDLMYGLHVRHTAIARDLLMSGAAHRSFLLACIGEEQRVMEYLYLVSRSRLVAGRLRDRILAMGERLAAVLAVQYLNSRGHRAVLVDPRHFLVISRRRPLRYDRSTARRAVRRRVLGPLQRGVRVVVPGYYGRTPGGRTVTLGRGGSDFTAAVLTMALRAEELQVWTDVPGFMTADPEIVPEARPVPQIDYDLALVVTRFGVKRYHPAALEPVARARIPVWILSPLAPGLPGTRLTAGPSRSAGPLLITSLAPVLSFRLTWISAIRPGLRAAWRSLASRWEPVFLAVSERPPCVLGLITTGIDDFRARWERRARRLGAHLEIRSGGLVGVAGGGCDLETIDSVIERFPEANRLSWGTERFVPIWVSAANLADLVRELHRRLLAAGPSSAGSGPVLTDKETDRKRKGRGHLMQAFGVQGRPIGGCGSLRRKNGGAGLRPAEDA